MPANPPRAVVIPLSGRHPASRGVFGHRAVLAVVATCLFAATGMAQIYDALKLFGGIGVKPAAALIQGTDGNLYGVTYFGGAGGNGTIFKTDTSGTTFTTLHSFVYSDGAFPAAALIQGTDGNLYGTTYYGGANLYGTIFKIDTNGTTFTTLHSFAFTDGAYPSGLIQGKDGSLYGTTEYGGTSNDGTIFRIDTSGTTLTTLHSFVNTDGAIPLAGLIQATDGNLYGTTNAGGANGGGTIFKLDINGTTFTTLRTFAGSDGASPYASLIQGKDGSLYGTTSLGGASKYPGYGTIFKIDTNGTTFTTLHSFAGSDGANPYAGLIQGTDGSLYGTTPLRGANTYYGTIFKTDTNGSTFTTLHSFALTDGANPAGLIQGGDGNLYGTTNAGGANGDGTIFKIDASGTTFTTLHSFANSDGAAPYAGLIQATDGNLYGTTYVGGASSNGTIFKIDTNGTTFTTLHSFSGSDGAKPNAGLIQGTDGNLYGMTEGGAGGYGTIFKLDATGTTFTTLHSFAGADGAYPTASLIQGKDGNLYGTTLNGGASGYGTIFKTNTNGTTFTTLHSFAGSDGSYPYAGLIQGRDGNLYGATYYGPGGTGYGTIFKLDALGTTFTTLYSFTGGSDGSGPYAGVIQATDGNLYGTTYVGGASSNGTIFKLDTTGTAFTTLHSFAGADGAYPTASLIQGTDGNFYGTTWTGGPPGEGVVFRFGLGCFFDVLPTHPFSSFICTVARDGITAGCGGGSYCPDNPVTRAQMAVFLLRAEHGSSYTPPTCKGMFADVPCPGGFAVNWIEQLSTEGITAGCGGGNYCPGNPVTRAQMAIFLLRAEHGSGYTPPVCHGVFADVPCPGGVAVDWIEQLSTEGITAGCGGGNYCPDDSSTRGEMAVFLVKTFNLQ